MDITYLGHSSFRLRGKNATVVTDPYDSVIGLKFPIHTTADIVTVSHEHKDHSVVSQIDGNPYCIYGPGEYEVKGVGIVGHQTYHDEEKGALRGRNTIYRIEIDGMSVVHLGDLGHVLTSDQVDELDGVDILFIPVGGVHALDPVHAVTVIHEIEPSIVIPMHYGRPELNREMFRELLPIEAFMKEIEKEIISQTKLTITKDKLPEEMQVIVLE